MVEYTVEDDLDALCVTFLYEVCKVRIVSQTAVELFIIGGLLAVSHGFKQWSDIDGIAADLFDMTDPGKGLI